MSFGGHDDALALRGVLEHLEWQEAKTLVFVIPDPTEWVLPLYELALLSRARFDAHGATDAEVVVLTAEEDPMELMGERTSDTVQMLLARSGVRVRTGVKVLSAENRTLRLADGSSVPADHVFTLPRWHGTPILGLPADHDGFLRIDDCCRVHGLDGVYAAGNITAGFPKQGGLAARQADAAASAVLADLGWPVEAVPFEPVLAGVLLTGDLLATIRDRLPEGEELPWKPPSKIVARHLAPYLGTREPESRHAAVWQREHRIPAEIEVASSPLPDGAS